jgi:putative transcriptional regulator
MSARFGDMMTGLDEVEAFLAGEKVGYKVTLPADVDVKSIRKRLNMTQARFSDTFGFSLDAVKHWEGGRRTPESSARAFLTVIAKNPNAVIAALHPAPTMVARKRSRPFTSQVKKAGTNEDRNRSRDRGTERSAQSVASARNA